MKILLYVIITIPFQLMAYNLYDGGELFYDMTPLTYLFYFVMPAVAVVAYFVGGMETEESLKRKLDKKQQEKNP